MPPARDGLRPRRGHSITCVRPLMALALAAMPIAVARPSYAEPPPPASAPTPDPDALLERLRLDRGIPALQAAVMVDGQIVYSTASGLADIGRHTPAETTTRFRIASISKAVTGTALARLAARGVIELDAPISNYLTDLPDAWRSITPRHLAGHTSGIRHYRAREALRNRRYASLADALTIFRDDPLAFPPGTDRAYSTYGFTLLGVVMEHAARKPFMTIIHDEVLDPLAMTSTTEDRPDADDAALPYLVAPGRLLLPAPPTDHSYKVPGGGMLSTAEDLTRLAWASLKPGPLEPETIRILHQPITTADGRVHPYALGWSILGEGESIAIGHTGSQSGASCALWADRRTGVVAAILCNAQQGSILFSDARALALLFAPPEPASIPLSPDPESTKDRPPAAPQDSPPARGYSLDPPQSRPKAPCG